MDPRRADAGQRAAEWRDRHDRECRPRPLAADVSRMNWLHPPFNNARQAAFMALRQQDFLEAVVGNPRYWRTCKALFTCGSPLATDAGMDGLLEGNAEKARQMLREAGYDGTPIVLLQSSDVAVLTNLAPV